jgi:general stress protein CsbA
MKFIPWVLAIMAAWLIAAPVVLGYANTEIAMKNDVGVGMVMLIGTLCWGFLEWRHHGFSKDLEAQQR